MPFAELGRQALHDVVGTGKPIAVLWASLPTWPLWPDVAETVPRLAERYRLGLLSNVDDELLAATQLSALPFDRSLWLTSQRLGRYKPDSDYYQAAAEVVGGRLVHLAASARDVRGALEAGIDTIRIVRPGHRVDPDGPQPRRAVESLARLLEPDFEL